MTLPLYQRSLQWPRERSKEANAGLWHDKYGSEDWKAPDAKINWLKNNFAERQGVGDRELLKEHQSRRAKMVESRSGVELTLKTDARFVSGLGQNHPVENGFCWHRTLGVPYLPGSGVKGMVRAWAKHWAGGNENVSRIFGPDSQTTPLSVGSVVFLDALPVDSVRLEVDVMTPHYAPYYTQQGKGELPGDWNSPVPVPFLTVARDQSFSFALLPRTTGNAPSDVETAKEWLCEALTWLGAGAKTAVGYGRFVTEGIT